MNCIKEGCENENLTDRPMCGVHFPSVHWSNRTDCLCGCREAKQVAVPAATMAALAVEDAIIIRTTDRGFRVHPPYKHDQFIAAFKRTVGGRWYADSLEWFIPATKLEWTKELLGYWFKLPVAVI